MTNHLDSIIFEGIVSYRPVFDGVTTNFDLVNRMFTENNGERKEHFSTLPVYVEGDLAEPASCHLKKGMAVRCVSKLLKFLEEQGRANVVIMAQHIEYKNDPNKSKVEVIENN